MPAIPGGMIRKAWRHANETGKIHYIAGRLAAPAGAGSPPTAHPARTRIRPGTQPFQRALRRVGQPLTDRVERPRPGQHPRGRHRQHPGSWWRTPRGSRESATMARACSRHTISVAPSNTSAAPSGSWPTTGPISNDGTCGREPSV
jgi:hypothetical protein